MLLLNGIQIVLRSHQYSTQALHIYIGKMMGMMIDSLTLQDKSNTWLSPFKILLW